MSPASQPARFALVRSGSARRTCACNHRLLLLLRSCVRSFAVHVLCAHGKTVINSTCQRRRRRRRSLYWCSYAPASAWPQTSAISQGAKSAQQRSHTASHSSRPKIDSRAGVWAHRKWRNVAAACCSAPSSKKFEATQSGADRILSAASGRPSIFELLRAIR